MAHWSSFGIQKTFFLIVMNASLEYSKSAKSINVEMLVFIDKCWVKRLALVRREFYFDFVFPFYVLWHHL